MDPTPEKWLLWCSLAMALLSMCGAAACAVACSRLASRSIRALNRKSPSESTLAKLEVDQAELFSSLGSLAKTVKRLSSRYGMQETRERQAGPQQEEIPLGLSKQELRRRMGLAGKSHTEIALLAQGRGS